MVASASLAPAPPAPGAAPPPGNPRFGHLDALRAAAALAVFCVHVSGLAGTTAHSGLGAVTSRLNVGVTVFFVLSGFLLYRPMVAAARAGAPRVRLGDYALRRALRIVPGYWLALTVLALTVGLPGVLTADWWRYYAFGQAYALRTTLGGIAPAWTLCVEVSFYALLPLLARLLAPRRPRVQLAALATLGLGTIVLRTVLHASGTHPILGSTLPSLFDWFAAGMVLAVLSVARDGEPLGWLMRRPWASWGVAAAAFAGAVALGAPRDYAAAEYTGPDYFAEHLLYLTVGVGLVLPAVFGAGARGPRRVLATPLLARLGLISYGIFLWHLPLLAALHRHGVNGWAGLLALGLPATLAAAGLSWVLVERPALRLKPGQAARRRAAAQPLSA